MVTVRAQAAEELKAAIQSETTDPEVGIRLVPSPTMPNRLEMVLDKVREGDQVVESEGVKVLIISPELAPALEGMVIDYQQTPLGGMLTISKPAPGT